MALLCCPVGFSEKIIAVLQMKKSQIDAKNKKNPKNFPLFQDFMHFFQNFDELCELEH